MLRRISLSIALILSQFPNCDAQSYFYQQFREDMGLLPGSILSLHEQPGRFVWIGTTMGLQRFDGVAFKTYFAGAGKQFLPSPNINDIEAADERYLYLATTEGFARLDTWWDTVSVFNRKRCPELPSDLLHDLLPDGPRRVWLAPDNRNLTAFDPSNNSFETFPWKEFVAASGISAKAYLNINQLLRKNAHELWLLTNIGIFSFHTLEKRFRYFPHPTGWIQEFTGAYDDGNGKLWVSPGGAGLYCLQHYTGQWQRWMSSPEVQPLTDGSPRYNVLPFTPGILLVATVEGLGVFDLEQQSWHVERPDVEHAHASLPKGHVNQICRDAAGGIWIGADGGLARLDPFVQQFRPYPVYRTRDTTASVVLDIQGADVRYVAPRGSGGLKMENKRDGKLTTVYPEAGIKLEFVRKMLVDDAGGLWVLDFHRMFWLDKKLGQLRVVNPPDWLENYGSNVQFNDMCLDGQGNILISASRAGCMKLNTSSMHWERIFYRPETLDVDINGVVVDKTDGSVWFGSRFGRLYRYFPGTNDLVFYEHNPADPHTLAANMPMGMAQSGDGSIWVVTEPGGVSRYDRENNRFDNFFVTNGLPVNLFRQVLTDDKNRVWLRYDGGLCLFDPADGRVQIFDQRFGIELPKWGSYMSLESGRILLMGVAGGYIRIDPDDIADKIGVKSPVIVSATVMFEEMLPLFRAQGNRIELPYNRNFLNFHFSTFNFSTAASERYQYQLEGYDKEWVLAKDPVAAYPNLPPGKYLFRARVDRPGAESSVPVLFEIRPHFSQTIWFKGLLLAIFLALVFGIYRYRIQQFLKVQRLRNKIAGDLHDDVASTVSSISFYSDFAKKQLGGEQPKVQAVLEKIGDNAREALDHMRDIVWAIRAENDEFRFLRARMQAIGQSLCSTKDIAFEWSENGLSDKSEIPLTLRKNIFLMYKECLNNALKYADCQRIRVTFEKNGKYIELRVQDDGKGFDPEIVPSGTGLRSLQARALESQGQLSLQSAPGAGTSVSFRAKIP